MSLRALAPLRALPWALAPAAAMALIVAAAGPGCGQAILTAPEGSTLTVTANPPFIMAHGGVSVISVLVVEPTGTVVPDGTVVQFFTTLGRIDEQGRTNDGVARVNLTADSRSGIATVTAVSGGPGGGNGPGPTTSPTTGPTASPTANPTATPTVGPTIRPPLTSAPFAEATGEGSVSVEVAIGNTRPTRIVLTALPTSINSTRPARITAIVLDEFGNPAVNVPVFFNIVSPTNRERLDSEGRPQFTDSNGIAEDVLRTNALPTDPPRPIVVRAVTANGVEATATVFLN